MKNTKGSALILVILIISLISILTIISSERIVNTTKNSLIFSSQTQSYWYAMALESSASNYLSSKKQLDKIYDEKAQIGDLPKINVSFDNVNVQGTIRDLHSCFNLNIPMSFGSAVRQEGQTAFFQAGQRKNKASSGGAANISKKDMEILIEKAANTAPAQTIRIEQAPMVLAPQVPPKK